MTAPAAAKDEPLEALRGLAAFSVLGWHLMLGLAPARSGILPGFDPALSWVGQPWYGLLHGSAAVAFFFVLSGFVLTRRALGNGDAAILGLGALKRWPRLAGPATIACLVSWLCFTLGLYVYPQAGAMTGSPWLSAFAYAPMPPDFVPSLGSALAQGGFWTFFRGDASFNSNLWTMHWEFLGSFAAFGLALALLHLTDRRMRAGLIAATTLALFHMEPWLVTFPIGVGLALLSAEGRLPRLRPLPTGLLLFLALVAASYAEGSLLGRETASWLGQPLSGPLVHALGAACLLVAAEGSGGLRRVLSGPFARWLGRMSFPVYLLHIPVLCSAGCLPLLALGNNWAGLLAASAATVLLTVIAAWPVAHFDHWWTGRINRLTRPCAARLLRPQQG